MQHVWRALMRLVYRNRARDEATPTDVSQDVNAIKAFLHANIGSTYAIVTQASDDNVLDVDMSEWGGLRSPRASAPFNQIRRAQYGYREYVQHQVTKLCPWQRWY